MNIDVRVTIDKPTEEVFLVLLNMSYFLKKGRSGRRVH